MKPLEVRIPLLHSDISHFTTPTNEVIQYLGKGGEERCLVRWFAHTEAAGAAEFDGCAGRSVAKVLRAVLGDGFEVRGWEAGVEDVECRVADMDYEGLGG